MIKYSVGYALTTGYFMPLSCIGLEGGRLWDGMILAELFLVSAVSITLL